MNFLNKLLGRDDDRAVVRPLYAAIVAEARQPFWYERGGVADSIDGRFEMVSAVLALVLIRMEALGVAAREPSTLLTETFVEDMDGQLRQLGIGDIVVGKHIGRMMGALGGRLGAYRQGFAAGGDASRSLISHTAGGGALSRFEFSNSRRFSKNSASNLNASKRTRLTASRKLEVPSDFRMMSRLP